MKTSTKLALVAYVKALQEEGFTSIHVGSIIPCAHPKDREYRVETGRYWTQFVNLEGALDDVATYDRNSGWIFFHPMKTEAVAA
jgi:hypothetical protein